MIVRHLPVSYLSGTRITIGSKDKNFIGQEKDLQEHWQYCGNENTILNKNRKGTCGLFNTLLLLIIAIIIVAKERQSKIVT